MINEVSNEQIYELLLQMRQAIDELKKEVKEMKEELKTTSQTTAYLTRDLYLIKNEK